MNPEPRVIQPEDKYLPGILVWPYEDEENPDRIVGIEWLDAASSDQTMLTKAEVKQLIEALLYFL